MSETPEAEVVAWRWQHIGQPWHVVAKQPLWTDERGPVVIQPLVPLAAYQSAIQERDAARQQVEDAWAAFGAVSREVSLAEHITAALDELAQIAQAERDAAEASNASLRQQLDGVREAVAHLYVTDDELRRIRNKCEKVGDVKIWALMAQMIVDNVLAVRAALKEPTND